MNQDAPDPAGPAEHELSAVLDRFEEAWHEGTVPNLETFLPTAVLAGSRQELLGELVKLDLEFRWRQKQSSRPDETLIQPGQQEQQTLVYDSSAAANGWLLEKYVEEYPQLGSVDQLPLALIVEEYRVRQRWGDRPSHQDYLERFAQRNEDLSAALSGVDQELAAEKEGTGSGQGQASTETVTVVAGQDGKSGPGSAIGVGSVVGDYELLQEIGRGGMGVVYRARQLSLQREVALKMILPGQLADQEAVERFYTEAQIVGQLRHPNIVMVYEVAEHDGNHYFSMDYIEGDSLAERIRQAPLSARESASFVAEVARAIQFAHEAGILHRDLKPSNILIDGQGKPLVTDFGLAKRTEEDAGITRTGNIVGTPSYMPPEQVAAGGQDSQGPASDVYSLGAILYELLTGRPPFRSDSMLETLMQVLEQEPVAPRLLAPGTDRDLETITLKCLEKDPQRRYGSAAELADEIGRYAKGEPILARPVSSLERAWRWCKRRPAVAALSSAVMVALVAGTLISSYFAVDAARESRAAIAARDAEQELRQQAEAARESAELARDSLQREKARADKNLLAGLNAVDYFLTEVSTSELLNLPRTEPLRRKLLIKAREYYQQFQQQDVTDPTLRAKVVDNYSHLIEICSDLGDWEGVVNASRASRKLLELSPGSTGNTHKRAETYLGEGNAFISRGDFEQAIEAYNFAAKLFQQLVEANPDLTLARKNLALVHTNLGQAYERSGQKEKAVSENRRAVTTLEDLVEDDPDRLVYSFELARSCNNSAALLVDLNREDEATPLYERAMVLLDRWSTEAPQFPLIVSTRADTYSNYGKMLGKNGQPEKEIEMYRQAVKFREPLLRDHPDVPQFAHLQAVTYRNLGTNLSELGQDDEALAVYKKALVIREGLVKRYPQVDEYSSSLWDLYGSLVGFLESTGQGKEAIAAYQNATNTFQRLADEDPENGKQRLAALYQMHGLALVGQKQFKEASEPLGRAIVVYGGLLEANPEELEFANSLAYCLMKYGALMIKLGDYQEAVVTAGRLTSMTVPQEDVEVRAVNLLGATKLLLFSSVVVNEDDELVETKRLAQAEDYEKRAVKLLRQLQKDGFFERTENVNMLQKSDFNPLRKREDFRELLKDIEVTNGK